MSLHNCTVHRTILLVVSLSAALAACMIKDLPSGSKPEGTSSNTDAGAFDSAPALDSLYGTGGIGGAVDARAFNPWMGGGSTVDTGNGPNHTTVDTADASTSAATVGDGSTGGGNGTEGITGTGGATGLDGSKTADSGSTGPDYSGLWTGLTSDGLLIKFKVFAGAVTQVTVDWRIRAPGPSSLVCIATGETTTTFGIPVAISNGRFTKGPISGKELVYTVGGTFLSGTQSNGTLTLTYTPPDCSATTQLSWTAEKVVCDDGRIEWPETCDNGNTVSSDGCSDICQLTPVAETEPNNTITTAGPPITNDAIRSGSISQGTDVDVYAVQNPYPGTIAIVLESHGETIGTCGVDTLIQVVDTSSKVLSQGNDGSRALFCSLLQFSLSAGQIIYVVVSSAKGASIPTYNLHIKFQHS